MRQRDLKWLQCRLPDEIRALTVHQPFAWAIASGHKSVENRRKPPPRELIGEIFAIHAGRAPITERTIGIVEERVRGQLPGKYEKSAIIGFARIVGSVRRIAELDIRQRPWFDGPYGWLLEDVVMLPTPVECSGQLNFWRVPSNIMKRLRAQIEMTTKSHGPTAFSWGYKGWGNATAKLIEMFDAVEHWRGFKPALFVDVRARREVRAEGFKGRCSPFERELGKGRYRWMPDLGNNAVKVGHGPNRLIAPNAVHELLGLILRAQQEKRRVVFFCSCASPCGFASCHRRLISRLLVKSARRLYLPLRVEEWPGGEPKRGAIPTILLKEDALATVLSRKVAKPIDLGRTLPAAEILSLPVGGLVRLKSQRQEVFASAQGVEVRCQRWRLAIFLHPVQADDTQTILLAEAKRWRAKDRLAPSNSDFKQASRREG